MAHWLTAVIMLAYLGGLTAPSPVSLPFKTHTELITELDNITNNQKAALCNGSMVWSVNLTGSQQQYCAALESLIKVSNCSAIRKTQKLLFALCPQGIKDPSVLTRDTKIEVIQFAKDLLTHLRKMFRLRAQTGA